MKVFKKDLNSGRIDYIDSSITTKNMAITTERQYQLQRAERYLQAKSNIGIS